MDIKQYISKFFSRACVYFTAMILIYTAVVALINNDANEILIGGVRILFFFIFSLLFSLANVIYGIKSISSPVRFLIHYLITLFACCICLFLPASLAPSGFIVGIVFFSVIYFLVAAIYALILSLHKKRLEKKEVYEKKFSK